MKNLFRIIFFFLITLLNVQTFAESLSSSQTADLVLSRYGIYLNSNGTAYLAVVIEIKRTNSTPWSLGTSSFVFNYNYNVMTLPVEADEGRWDNDSNSQYVDQTIASYDSGRAESIEIGQIIVPIRGTPVPTNLARIGSIFFTANNPNALHNLSWNRQFSIITDAEGNDITSGMNFINPPNDVVPVELSSFTANILKNDITLDWTTVNELNNSGFKIERMKDGLENTDWKEIGFVKGEGSTGAERNYEFIDKNLQSGKYNYRLKQIDFNGNFAYYNLSNKIEIVSPAKFSLSQNYPNPFNPVTFINYSLETNSFVLMKIYDSIGKEIATPVNGKQDAGYYSINFDGSGLASGIYYYRLLVNHEHGSNRFSQTLKMILIR